ncbi:hypothetical protein HG531_010999 [Fusarium graminearum]|nr:hypothetical protein HG531_010999 [Fusarium graminearum]
MLHLLDAVLDLLLAGDTRRVDVVDTRSDVAGILRVDKDTEELGIGLAVLNGEDIGIKSSDGVEEVLEFRVTEVRVDLSGILDTSGGEAESLDSPLEVGVTLLTGAEGKTLTESGLIDLDDIDAGLLKVDDLVTEGKSKLLSLDGLVDIVTGERPSKASDGTSVCGESVTLESLTEELNHVVTLRLTVDKDIEVKLLLDFDVLLDLLLNEAVVLLNGDLTLGELVSLDSDLLGLGERSNGGGGEEGEVQLLLLLADTGSELALALVVLLGDLGLTVLDLRIVGAGRVSTSLDRLGVSLELLADGGRALGDGLGNESNLRCLLSSEREPVGNLGVQLLLAGKSVRGVEERAGGGGNDTVLAELLDSGLDNLDGTLQVGLPDVTSIDDTGREDGVGANGTEDLVKLLRVADKVDVETVDVLGEEVKVVDDVTEVGGENDLGDLVAKAGELLIGGLESILGLLGKIEDKNRLVNLDGLGTSLLQLSEELLIDGEELLEKVDRVDLLVTVGLAEVKERDRANKDGAGADASILGLLEVSNSLGALSELEGLAVLEGGLDVVVVRVEPLDHLQRGDIDTLLLVTTAHGEVLVNGVKAILGVSLGNGLEEVILDLVEDVVVESKVVAGDDVDTGILLDLPVSKAETLGLS